MHATGCGEMLAAMGVGGTEGMTAFYDTCLAVRLPPPPPHHPQNIRGSDYYAVVFAGGVTGGGNPPGDLCMCMVPGSLGKGAKPASKTCSKNAFPKTENSVVFTNRAHFATQI